jgi:hypothetical protein
LSSIKKIVETIDKSVNGFMDKVPGIQKKIYAEIVILTKDLKLDSKGNIKNTIDNYRILSQLKTRLRNVIFDKQYVKASKELISSYDEISKVQKDYFATFTTSPSSTTQEILNIVRQESIAQTVLYLSEQGIDINIISKAQTILQSNITSGGSYADFQEAMKVYIQGNKENLGAFEKYANTIVTDSINTYSRTYSTIIAEDLGLEWFIYTGSLLTTSREWCVYMVKKKYVHISEMETILHGNIDGVDICSSEIPCNKKTKLPNGMKTDTNVSNLKNYAGGWNCGHGFYAVAKEAVPKNIRDKILPP